MHGPDLYLAKNEEIYGIVSSQNLSWHFELLLERKHQHMDHVWISSGLLTDVIHFQPWYIAN